VVVTGATGAIGKQVVKHFGATPYDPRKDEWPGCAILVNCMGVTYDTYFHEADADSWSDVIWTNLLDTAEVIRKALPEMREKKYGRIINLSSVVSQMGVRGTSAYAASKAGLNGMIKSIAIENARHGILINNLNLGYMDLGMTHKIKNYEKIKETIPTLEFGSVDEVISAIHFLVRSNYITGTTIDINGGLW